MPYMYELDLPDDEKRFEEKPEEVELSAPVVNGKCPLCNQKIGLNAKVCLKCGFDLVEGENTQNENSGG